MDDFLASLSDGEKEKFLMVAGYAFRLGYKAKKDKAKSLGYTFNHPKIKRLILRFTISRGKPVLKLKFFASAQYSGCFQGAVKAVIEEFDYRYTGCYGCGKCAGTEGYRITYPDGREYYRCGTELIELVDIENLPLPELLDLFQAQHDYYLT